MSAVRTTCAYCGVGCGVRATVTGPRAVSIAGDPDHLANRGRLCSKGTHLGETVGLEGRLLHPEIDGRRVSWDAATAAVAKRFAATIAEHGPDSVAFYVSGQLLTEDYYVANKLMKGFIGSGNIDTNSRLCMASAVAAHNRAFGEDVVPASYADLDAADLILLVGSNTAWCHPVVWQRIEAARATRGTKLVVIDPRRTETAEQADLHVAIDPDGDVALFMGLLAEMARRGLVDHDYLAAHVDVGPTFWDGLAAAPPADAALAVLVAAHPRMITLFSQGANQSVSGTDKGNAIINLHLAMGRIGKEGAGPFSITGQPNAMGGREVGGLANALACHLGFAEDERADVAAFWKTDRLCAGPGLKAVDMFRAVDDGRIRAIWVMATNPAVSMPDAGFVRAALAKCPLVVVSDMFADTDTARLAHIRLPALGWGEKDGTVTNSERMISRQRALFPAPGVARADWRIVCDVATAMGHGDAFAFAGPAAIFREYAAMTALAARRGRKLDLTAWADLSDAAYAAMEPFVWGGASPYADGGFAHPGGRARLVPVALPERRPVDPLRPLRLNTARYRDQWHTMTRTGLSPRLGQHRREPLVEVHPHDAAEYRLADGGLATVHGANGRSIFRVLVSDAQRPGTLSVPMHWTEATGGAGQANRLTAQRVDPVSGQPGFKDNAAAIAPYVPDWRAFLVQRGPAIPVEAAYRVRTRVAGGWLIELAGSGAIDVAALLPEGERLEAVDRARGLRRIAVRGEDGALRAALFLTRSGTLPAREWIAAQLAEAGASAAELLAGRPAVPVPDRGPLVCVCFDVGEATIADAVAARGLCSVAAVGELLSAGTNCGSCRPAIARIIAATLPVEEAAE